MWQRLNKLIKPNGAIVLFGSEPFSSALRMSNIKNYKYDWVWKKHHTNQLNAKKQPLRENECISILHETRPVYITQFSNVDPYNIDTKNYKGSETLVSREPKRLKHLMSKYNSFLYAAVIEVIQQDFSLRRTYFLTKEIRYS